MLANTLTITAPDVSGADDTFAYVLIDNNGDRHRTWTEAPLGQPTKLIIKHSSSGKVGDVTGRHLVSLERTKKDGTLQGKLVINTTVSVSENGLFTDLEIISMLRQLGNLWGLEAGTADTSAETVAFVAAIRRGEG